MTLMEFGSSGVVVAGRLLGQEGESHQGFSRRTCDLWVEEGSAMRETKEESK